MSSAVWDALEYQRYLLESDNFIGPTRDISPLAEWNIGRRNAPWILRSTIYLHLENWIFFNISATKISQISFAPCSVLQLCSLSGKKKITSKGGVSLTYRGKVFFSLNRRCLYYKYLYCICWIMPLIFTAGVCVQKGSQKFLKNDTMHDTSQKVLISSNH